MQDTIDCIEVLFYMHLCLQYINTISNPTTTAVDPMPAPIPIAVGLLSSSDVTVKQEVDNEIYYT